MSRRILVTGAGSGPSNNLMRSLLHGEPASVLLHGEPASVLLHGEPASVLLHGEPASVLLHREPASVLMGCHSDRFLLKKSPAQRNFLIPPLDTDEGDAALRSIVEEARVELVVPGNDRDARAVAAIREKRALACRSFLPALKTIEACQDKGALSQFLRARGIPAPRTHALTDRDSLEQAWRALEPAGLAWCRIRRGFASRGATMVRDVEQAWSWISYWNTMRDVPVEDFTLCEFLPGRDYNVQGLWLEGRLALIKMCERLSYLNAEHHPSGMASTPALAKTVREPAAVEACEAALRAIDGGATGVFSFDLKENQAGEPCITEINAGRFCMITNIHDLTGRHNMARTYVRLAFGQSAGIDDPREYAGEHYLVRDLDTLPMILPADALFEGIESVHTHDGARGL